MLTKEKFYDNCLLLFLLPLLILSGCKPKEPAKLGFLGGMSGRTADLGLGGLNGVTLAIEKVNLEGGINGLPVQLIVKNDEQNPEIAASGVESLIKSGAKIIIGPMTSSMAEAVIPLANASGTVLLSPTVTSTDFTGKYDNFLRVCGTLDNYAKKNARYQSEKLGKRKAVIIYDDSNRAYSERWMTEFTNAFKESGARVISTIKFTSGKDKVFLDTARNILDANADLVVIIANSVDASSITQQLRKLNPKISISLAEWSSTDRFLELTGSYAEGVYLSQFIDLNSSSTDYLLFRSEYLKRFDRPPNYPALASYDAAMVAIEALRKQSQKTEPAKELIISVGKFKGLQHTIEIDRFGDSQTPNYLSVIRHGKYLSLE